MKIGLSSVWRYRKIRTVGAQQKTSWLEAEYKKDKAREKSSFSRAKNRLIGLLDQQELPSRNEVQDVCRRMNSCAELATDVLTNFSEFYIRINEMQKSMRVK